MERGLSRHGRLLVRTLRNSTTRRRLLAAVLYAPLFAGMSGCAVRGRFFPHRPPPCALQPGASYSEIVAKVNQNFAPPAEAPLTAWDCRALMSVKGTAGMAPATISVQAPHQFRIRASNPFTGAEVADLGSNSEEIWFWGQGGPGVITVKHEDLPRALNQLQIPIEPEWLLEVLGVVPIDASQYEMVRPAPDTGYVELVADRSAPNGEPVRRIIRIDTCSGHVSQHRVESIDGTTIAVAHLEKYEPDATGKYVLPRYVRVAWPQANAEMTLYLGEIQTDPQRLASNWTVPQIRGYQQLRIGGPASRDYSGEMPPQIQPVGGEQREFRSGERAARLTLPILSADAPPAGYSAAASQSSSAPPLREQESGPRPFPSLP
jgi:hypothetical protein